MENLKVSNLKCTFGIAEAVSKINESCSLKPGVSKVCGKYTELLKTTPEEALYESFKNDMAQFDTLSTVEEEVAKVNRVVESSKINMTIKNALVEMLKDGPADGNIGLMVESAVVNYLVNKTPASLAEMKCKLQLFESDRHVAEIIKAVTMDEYTQQITGKTMKMSLLESAEDKAEVLYTQEQVNKMIEDKVNEAREAEKNAAPKYKYVSDFENHIKLEESINRILSKEARNESVKKVCEAYLAEINRGVKENRLYESFISNLSQYNYLNAVDTELSALNDRISKYKQEINLTRIVEAMKETESYYIVEHIEGAVADYMANKNATSRVMLKQACQPFLFDRYVADIVRVVDADDSIGNLFHGSVVESEKLSLDNVYSPVLYVKENECIFNVGGVYYDRKGKSVSRLSKANVANLSESFKNACNTINSNRVAYDQVNDCFKVYSEVTGKYALVNESGVTIDGKPFDTNVINDNFLMMESYTGNATFYKDIKALSENYSTITDIDFVKRVSLNESNRSVDLFKMKGSLCIALNEGASSTFYRNVNPLQCRSYINEHMNINASRLFEEMMPESKEICAEIEDSKKAYEAYIEELKSKKKTLEGLKESGESEDEEAIDSAISMIDTELNDIMDDYKKYQKDTDEYIGKTKKSEDDGEDKEGKDKSAPDEVKNDVVDPLGDEAEKNGEETVNPDGEGATEEPERIADIEVPAAPVYAEFDGILDSPKTDGNFEVVKVSFDRNVKNGKTAGKGTVIVMTPSVNSNGDVSDEITSVTFQLDQSKKPILNNEHMPLSMYNAIVDAISSAPEIETVEVAAEGSAAPEGDASPLDTTTPPAEAPKTEDPLNVEDPAAPATVDVPELDANADLTSHAEAPVNVEDLTQSASDGGSADTDAEVGDDPEANKKPADATPAEEVEDVDFLDSKDEAYVSVSNMDESHPIEVGILESDVRPLTLDDVAEKMEELGIGAHKAVDKGSGEDAIIIELTNRAEVIGLRKFFEHMFNTPASKFFEAFPELRCFESFAYKRADKLFESVFESGDSIEYDLPYSPELADELLDGGYITDKERDALTDDDEVINVVIDDVDEVNDFCDYVWDIINDMEISEYRTQLIDAMGEISTTVIPVELDVVDGLVSKIEKKGLTYDYADADEESIIVFVKDDDEKEALYNICDKVGIDTSDEGPLAELNQWTEELEDSSMNEGVKITVEDTETHKKVTIDTDELNDEENKGEEEKSEEEKDSDSGFGNDTELYASKDDAAQAAENGNNGASENTEKPNESAAAAPEKKVKFRFKPKKLHEGAIAAMNVGDVVKYKGRTGKILEKRGDSQFVVLVQGATHVCEARELTQVTKRADNVEYPHKFDKDTLKQLN